MLHGASTDGVLLGAGVEDLATSMAISQGCKRVSSELYVQQKCEELMAGRPANEVAVGIASVGGYAGCMALGTGPLIAGLCATAAGSIANWVLSGYTPADRAALLYDAARGGSSTLANLVTFYGGARAFPGWPSGCVGSDCVQRTLPAIVRDNLFLLGAGNVWTKPRDQAISVILMAIAASGRSGEGVYYWVSPRHIGDLPSPPRLAVTPQPYHVLTAYPSGSITAYDPALAAYRIAAPVGLAGAAYREVGTSATKPAGVTEVPLPTYRQQTGATWYRSGKVWAGAALGVGALALGGVALFRRRRR